MKFLIAIIIFIVGYADYDMAGIATHLGHTTKLIGASGLHYNPNKPYAAHRTIPYGTWVWVYNDDKKNPNYGLRVKVMIIDGGPKSKRVCIDMEPHSLWTLAGKKCGGLKVRLAIADTSHSCNTFNCLKPRKTRK